MIKKMTLIFLIFLTCYFTHTLGMEFSQQSKVIIEDITEQDQDGLFGEDNDEKEAEAEEKTDQAFSNSENPLGRLQWPENDSRVLLYKPTIAHTLYKVPHRPTGDEDIIPDTLRESHKICAATLGNRFGATVIEVLTRDPSVSKMKTSMVDSTKLSLKLQSLSTTTASIYARRASIQAAILIELKEDSQDKEDELNKSSEDDEHLQHVSMQQALQLVPLTPEEITELQKSVNSLTNHISTTLEKY